MGIFNKYLTGITTLCGLSGSRIYGGNSGYVGYSKSKRAAAAEERGLRNKSQMDSDFKNEVNEIIVENGGKPVTLKLIKAAADRVKADEWHHTSKFGNQTNYYSAETIANFFLKEPEIKNNNSLTELTQEFENFIWSKLPIKFIDIDGVKRAVFVANNGEYVIYKSGFNLIPIDDSEPLKVKSAKAQLNNEKKALLANWNKKIYLPKEILDAYNSKEFFDYSLF